MFHLVNDYDRYGDYWECLYMYIGKPVPFTKTKYAPISVKKNVSNATNNF